ncbi:hypothetical protein [Neptunitalea chrysea]|nr:hypothetical protein [Neptunitalea chrysea]
MVVNYFGARPLLKLYDTTYTIDAEIKTYKNGIEYADHEFIKNN